MRYLNQSEDIPVDLNAEISVIKEMAEAIVNKEHKVIHGVDVIKLAYQGKILDEKLKVGNYTKADAIFQIFKLSKGA